MHIKSMIVAALLIFANASDGKELVKIHSEKLGTTTFVAEIKSSATSSVTVLKEGVDSYWLIDGAEEGTSASPIAITNKCLQASKPFEYFQLEDSDLILFSATHTLIYDTASDKVATCHALASPLASPFNYWSSEHRVRISGMRVVEGADESQNPLESEIQPHAAQTALAISCSENQYVTAGFHDQSLRLWSLRSGELLSENTLGRWYSSRKITDAAFLDDQLFVASSQGKIEARNSTSGEVLWHKKPCRSFPHFLPENNHSASSQYLFYRCSEESEFGYIQPITDSWKAVKMNAKGQNSALVAAIKLNDGLAVFSFRDGAVLLLSMQTGQIVQTVLPALPDQTPRLMAYNADQQKLYVVSEGTQLDIFSINQ